MGRSMDSRGHRYVLEPVCASALLKRNCSKEPLRSRHTPRIECDIQLETIPLKLSQVPPPSWVLCAVTVGRGLGWRSAATEGSQYSAVPPWGAKAQGRCAQSSGGGQSARSVLQSDWAELLSPELVLTSAEQTQDRTISVCRERCPLMSRLGLEVHTGFQFGGLAAMNRSC